MYLHSIFLQSIEKINSITFIGTLFIITLCILTDDGARACGWPRFASRKTFTSLQRKALVPSIRAVGLRASTAVRCGKRETQYNNCWDSALICSHWQIHPSHLSCFLKSCKHLWVLPPWILLSFWEISIRRERTKPDSRKTASSS